MITRIEAKGYRCLEYVNQRLGDFHVLVGQNASGKTTFLDTLAFLGKMLSDGLDEAVAERTENFSDLIWNHSGTSFELAVEAKIPENLRKKLHKGFETFRYEVKIGIDEATERPGILDEKAWLLLKDTDGEESVQRELFPMDMIVPESLFKNRAKGQRVLSKAYGKNDNFYVEVRAKDKNAKGWVPSFKLGSRKSALANLPEDEEKFPVATWFKGLMIDGVQKVMLNSVALRRSSPAGLKKGCFNGFYPDGSNLPWVVSNLERPENAARYKSWIAHVQTALPEIESIKTVERPEDRSRYLVLCYKGGLTIPAWMASDGTLRLLALTIPAFMPDFKGLCLIEEPENGIHPKAVETVFQSLSSVYGAQVLLATHSPVILSVADVRQVLCFKKTTRGATDIVLGSEHPALRNWKGEVNLGELYAGGVL